MTLSWSGDDQVRKNMQEYEKMVRAAISEVARAFAPIIETYAKDNASWTDRTALARNGLRGYTSEAPADGYPVEQLAADVVALYLSHQMDYGISLELEHSGQYAIILPTLEAHYSQIKQMLDGMLK